MNIFQKIGFANRILKAVKEIKKVIETTTIDDELKEIFATLVNCFERLKAKIPQVTDTANEIIGIIKNCFKIGKDKK